MDDIPESMRHRPRRQSQVVTSVREASEDGDYKSLREARKVKSQMKLSTIAESSLKDDSGIVSEDAIDLEASKPLLRPFSPPADERYEKVRIQLFKVLENGTPSDVTDMMTKAEGYVPLHHAAMLDPLNNQNILHFALKFNRIDIVEIIIENGSKELLKQLFTLPKTTRSALHQITELNNMELATKFMDIFPTPDEKVEVIKPETMIEIEGQRPRTFSAYHLAAFRGFTALVKLYLDSGIHVDSLNVKKDTALLWAARWGHNKTVEFLIERKADVSLENDKKSTALYWAVRYQLIDTVVILLEKGKANPNQTRLLGLVAPIVMASALGNNEIVKVLIDNGADVNITIRGGETPLHHAAKEGHLDVVQTLLDRNADLIAQDEKGERSLTLAAQNGHADVVRYLLGCGADMYHKNHFGFDSWYYAMTQHNDIVLRALTEHYNNLRSNNKNVKSPLCIAASLGNCAMIKILLKMRVDPEETDVDGNTFIHHAAINNQGNVIKHFHKKVSIDAQNNVKETAMHIACRRGSHDAVLELMERKAKTNVGNLKGETALHVAASSNKTTPEIARALVEHTIKSHDWESVNATDNEGNNALHIAGLSAEPDVLWEWRFVRFKDVDKEGNTPLHEAVISGKHEVLETALDIYENMQRDADINTLNKKSESVLHLAASAGFSDSITRLIFYGADLTCADKDGNTVLHRLVRDMAESKSDSKAIERVMETIIFDSVRWWCNHHGILYPGENESLFKQLQRKALLSLVNDYSNKQNLSVLGYAYKVGSHKFLNRILTMPDVMMFQRDENIYFDITHLTPTTNHNLSKCCNCTSARVQHSNSHIDLLMTLEVKGRASHVLDIPPVRQIERMYTAICAWAYGFFMILHILYMSVFSYVGIEIASKFRDHANGTPLSDTDPVLIAAYAIVPLEPAIGLLYVMLDICRNLCRRELPNMRMLLTLIFVIMFASLVFSWIILISIRNTNHDYVLSVCLCLGWMLSISFTRGFKGIHYFFKMLVNMIMRDVFRFLIFFSFVLLAFSFALHTLFQISTSIVNTYTDPFETIFLAFNMMIGMAELFDGTIESGMESVGRTATFAKAIYILYILLSTIILLNLLIAMMNDSYSDILRHQKVTWRVESVQIGIGIENMFPWFPGIFGRIYIERLRIGIGNKHGDDEDERWYLVTNSKTLDAHRPDETDEKSAGRLTSALEKQMQEVDDRIRIAEQRSIEASHKYEEILTILSKMEKRMDQ
ncbi:transient receptor potential cation channel subfamily A member 1-like [Pecten maximus]|uniref:transient receptor potential cation channel subfamily A member 1-like n=1 Tax=Pecten maximus TaxID=6579 RepID=UPI00145901B9|nr:transient receptor potential cation channel subfamily A member 1-like [Pecten maximus]